MFTTGLIQVANSNPVTFPKPLNIYYNLIYDISSLLCHGLCSYIMSSQLVTKRGQTGGRAQDQCSAFFSWYISLWEARLRLETVCTWVISRCLLTHLMQYNNPKTGWAEHSHPFFMEIPLRTLPVNMLDREWCKSLWLSLKANCVLCVSDSERKCACPAPPSRHHT